MMIGAFKSLLAGEQGKLPILTRGLRRNDAEVPRGLKNNDFMIKMDSTFQSLIVRDRCKLELWDRADNLDLGAPADLVPGHLRKLKMLIDD